ncbi:MAG TPA: FecR domain-containing protein [Polyangiaceae bacterium]|jgi:ferric-dicitrate binding protein FerR (iron transport regulator)|nr:FecR domain-containing protein [Polyangiaceae bacterium]
MTKLPTGPERSRLDALLERARAVQTPSRAQLDAGLVAVRAQTARERKRGRLFTRLALVGALLLMPCAWFVGKGLLFPALPLLTYDVQGGSVLDGGYLRENGHAGVSVAFSEGSRFVLAEGSRGRVRTVAAERARVGLEQGSAFVEVTPHTGRLWEVEAGPFVVTVKGTAFDVGWDPAAEQFELRLRHGTVVISGPVSNGELTLQAGQRVTVNLPQGTTLISEDRAESESSASGAVVQRLSGASPSSRTESGVPQVNEHGVNPSAESSTRDEKAPGTDAADGPRGPATADLNRSAAEAGKKSWSGELANGHWDAILTQAEQKGLDATLQSAPSEDLFALANAARYRQRLSLAQQALESLRRRFPGSPRSLDALFLLGRVQEARGAGPTQTLSYYDDYLTRTPNGSYAAEALGRKLSIVNQTWGPARAKPIARDYLQRFPKGSYVRVAQAVLDEN